LYESWNFGIAQCRSKYVYISTIGDSISAVGLQRLVEVADRWECDVVLSPPRLIHESGAVANRTFPIHDAVERLGLKHPVVVDGALALLLAVTYMRKAILGSSASNLYRVETLRRLPFPTDFGHAGDVGWGLKNAGHVRIGILPEPHSTFRFHRRSHAKKKTPDLGRRRIEVARASIGAITTMTPQDSRLLHHLCDAWLATVEAAERFSASKSNPAWFLNPAAWRRRAARERAGDHLAHAQAQALEWIAKSFPVDTGLNWSAKANL
jgi:hypothetical protein